MQKLHRITQFLNFLWQIYKNTQTGFPSILCFLQFIQIPIKIIRFSSVYIFWLLNWKKHSEKLSNRKMRLIATKNNKWNQQIKQAHRIFKMCPNTKTNNRSNENITKKKQTEECLTRPLVGKSNWFPLTKSKINKWHPNRLSIVFTAVSSL